MKSPIEQLNTIENCLDQLYVEILIAFEEKKVDPEDASRTYAAEQYRLVCIGLRDLRRAWTMSC